MGYETIVVRANAGVCVVILNRPDRKNAFNKQMVAELNDALYEAARDDEIRVVILTGAGDAFCSGNDFYYRELRTGKLTPEEVEVLRPVRSGLKRGKLLSPITDIILTLHNMAKPTIAMVPGDAVGGGFDLALACDMRFGSSRSRFMVGFTRLGVPPDMGSAWFLPRIVPVNKAVEIILTGDFISGEEAFQFGILNRLFPHETLEAETMAFAQRLARGAPIAQRLAKRLIYDGLGHDLSASLADGMAYVLVAIASADHQEGIAAIVENREPVFRDK